MNIDYEQGRFWLGAVNLAGTVAVFIYTWIATRDKDNSRHIKAVEEVLNRAVAELTSRMDRAETSIAHMPTQDEMSEMQGDMKAVKVFQDAMRLDVGTMRVSVQRIEDFLLASKR